VDPSEYTARRATLDDLPTLKGLWEVNRLPVLELERHLTEFQVVARPDGVIVGALALRSRGTQGLLHSEAVYSPPLAAAIPAAAWPRLQILARNQGLTRLWMHGEPAPAWQACGFTRARPGDLQKLPPALASGPGPWATVALIDEAVVAEVIEKEVTAFQQEAQAEHERLRQQALWFKWLAGLIIFGFFAGAVWLLYQVLSRTRRPPRR